MTLDFYPTIGRMKNPIPQIPTKHIGSPVYPVLLQSSHVSYGHLSGFHGAENSYIILFLLIALVMHVTYRNSRGSGGTGANGGAGNGNGGEEEVVIEPRVETCGEPPKFPGWILESSTGSDPGSTATYNCMFEDQQCFIVDFSICGENGVWSTVSACEKSDCSIK